MKFTLIKEDTKSNARMGEMETDHGLIKTPFFAPVGTQASVKTIHTRELREDIDASMILGNAYHLYLRPGLEIIKKAGGLHKFIGWERPILTDSGGYQVYSLAANRKISDEGVSFQSHIDGSKHFFSPQYAIDIQRELGADIIMAFDECTPYPCEYDYARDSMELTHSWLKLCCEHFDDTEPVYDHNQALFPIVQGSVYKDLRIQSAEFIASMDREGNAIGGLSVGEPHEMMYEMTAEVCSILPKSKPRYLMGVGTPANILESISLGIDMFDCVLPTRNGRNGMLYTQEGVINIKNEKWKECMDPIDSNGNTFVDSAYTRAYLRHLFMANEFLGKQIASIHNLGFYMWLTAEARNHIEKGDFASWKDTMVTKLNSRL